MLSCCCVDVVLGAATVVAVVVIDSARVNDAFSRYALFLVHFHSEYIRVQNNLIKCICSDWFVNKYILVAYWREEML